MKRSTAASRSATPVSMRRGEISRTRKGPAGSDIDAGSTTIKAILLDEDNRILYEYYAGNKGTPLDSTKRFFVTYMINFPPLLISAVPASPAMERNSSVKLSGRIQEK